MHGWRKQLRLNPDDDTLWLVFADWLDERGLTTAADLVRPHVRARVMIRERVKAEYIHDSWQLTVAEGARTQRCLHALLWPEALRNAFLDRAAGMSDNATGYINTHYARHCLGYYGLWPRPSRSSQQMWRQVTHVQVLVTRDAYRAYAWERFNHALVYAQRFLISLAS